MYHKCCICGADILRSGFVIFGNVYCNRCVQDNYRADVDEIDDKVKEQKAAMSAENEGSR